MNIWKTLFWMSLANNPRVSGRGRKECGSWVHWLWQTVSIKLLCIKPQRSGLWAHWLSVHLHCTVLPCRDDCTGADLLSKYLFGFLMKVLKFICKPASQSALHIKNNIKIHSNIWKKEQPLGITITIINLQNNWWLKKMKKRPRIKYQDNKSKNLK